MSVSYDDFESVMKKELELAVPTLFNVRAIEAGLEPNGNGGYKMELGEALNFVNTVTLDAVLLILRRYDEWSGAL